MSEMMGGDSGATAAEPAADTSVITSDAVGGDPGESEETSEAADSGQETSDKPAKPKGRKRKVTRGKQEIDVDLDDEDGILKLISDQAKYKVKVDKEDRDVTLDDLLKDYELREASYARMRQSAETTKKHEQMLQSLKSDPSGKLIEYLEDTLEVDPIELLWKLHEDEVRLQELATEGHPNYNPQQYAQAVAERARSQERKKIEREQARQRAQEAQEAEKKRATAFYEGLAAELKTAGVQPDDVMTGTIRQMVARLSQSGMPMDPKAIAYEAMRKVRETLASQLPSDPEALAEFLGEDRIKALNKLSVARARKAEPKVEQTTSRPKPKKTGKDDWAEAMRRFRNGN